jgi:general secretion pathway protein G
MKKLSRSKNLNAGFTLVELLVVIAIISLLSSVVITSLNSARAKARDAVRLSDMKQIKMALELFYDDHGHYPGPTEEGCSINGEILGDDSGPIETALAPYLKTIPKDPKYDGVTYYYGYDSQHCSDAVLGSCLCDGGTVTAFGFFSAESASFQPHRETCSGGDAGIGPGVYNQILTPYGP